MSRLNIELSSEDYSYLKSICAEKRVSIKDFVVPLIIRAIEDEEDALLARKAKRRLNRLNSEDLIPIEDAFRDAGWNV